MNPLLNKLLTLLAPRRQEYLAIDKNFNILEASFGVPRFADCPDEVKKGKDVRVSFPELIGLEDILIAISQGQQNSFELKGITRASGKGSPVYLDLSIIKNPDRKILNGDLVVFLEDVTEKMIFEQTLVQASNEKSLLLEALEASKDYLDKIITSMADALLVTTASGTIKTVNPAAQELFEYTEDELISQPISVIILDRDFLDRSVLSQDKGSPSERPHVICQTKTGKKVYVAFSCSAIQTDLEYLKDFAYVGRNVTEQKRCQQRLAVQYAVTCILSESAPVRETRQKILQAICENLEWELGELWIPSEYLGAAASESTQLRCDQIWTQPEVELQAFALTTSQTTFAPGVDLPGRVWATRSPQWITDVVEQANFVRKESALQVGLHGAFGFPIQDDSEILGVMIFFSCEVQTPNEDLLNTMAAIGNQLGQFIKRKQAEQALQESEERYRDLLENASDLIQSCDINGQFVYVNRAWRETLGYSEAQIQQMNLFEIIHPDCKDAYREAFYRVIFGENIDRVKTAFISNDGKKVSVEGNINCKFVEGKAVATRAIYRVNCL